VIPDDVKELATPVLAHRLVLSAAARISGVNASQIISDLLEFVPVPI
jgi:MoxR-like ATPase